MTAQKTPIKLPLTLQPITQQHNELMTPERPIRRTRRSKSAMKEIQHPLLDLPEPTTPTPPIVESFISRGKKRVQIEPPELPMKQGKKKTKKRVTSKLKSGSLLVFGSGDKESSFAGQCMSPNGKWTVLPRIGSSKELQKLSRHNASYTHVGGNCIVVSGGIDSQTLKRVNMVDLNSETITTLPSMKSERCAHSSVFFRKSIFVAGGRIATRKKKFTTDSVEK